MFISRVLCVVAISKIGWLRRDSWRSGRNRFTTPICQRAAIIPHRGKVMRCGMARRGMAWRGAVRYGVVHRAWHDTLSPSFMHNVLSRRRKRMRANIGRRERVISLHKDEELRPVTRREREIYFHKKVNRERHGCLNLRVSTCLRVSPLFANVRWKIYPLCYDGYPAIAGNASDRASWLEEWEPAFPRGSERHR